MESFHVLPLADKIAGIRQLDIVIQGKIISGEKVLISASLAPGLQDQLTFVAAVFVTCSDFQLIAFVYGNDDGYVFFVLLLRRQMLEIYAAQEFRLINASESSR
jgi:hypothetical protein